MKGLLFGTDSADALLIRELRPVDYARFIQQYAEGTGDHTRDRHQWLDDESARTLRDQATIRRIPDEIPIAPPAQLS